MFRIFLLTICLSSSLRSALTGDYVQTQPEQIHLSLGGMSAPNQSGLTQCAVGSESRADGRHLDHLRRHP